MTDYEKIARIVEWMGGWPDHKACAIDGACSRCGELGFDWPGGDYGCYSFNPFERIDDAMVVVEKLTQLPALFELFGPRNDTIAVPGKWRAIFEGMLDEVHGYGGTPARAIAEAAYQVIDKLTKGGRVSSTNGDNND